MLELDSDIDSELVELRRSLSRTARRGRISIVLLDDCRNTKLVLNLARVVAE